MIKSFVTVFALLLGAGCERLTDFIDGEERDANPETEDQRLPATDIEYLIYRDGRLSDRMQAAQARISPQQDVYAFSEPRLTHYDPDGQTSFLTSRLADYFVNQNLISWRRAVRVDISPTQRLRMESADYYRDQGKLIAKEKVRYEAPDLTLEGVDLVYDFNAQTTDLRHVSAQTILLRSSAP